MYFIINIAITPVSRKPLSAKEVLRKVTQKQRRKFKCEYCLKEVFNINRHLKDKHKETRRYRQLFRDTIQQRSSSSSVSVAKICIQKCIALLMHFKDPPIILSSELNDYSTCSMCKKRGQSYTS